MKDGAAEAHDLWASGETVPELTKIVYHIILIVKYKMVSRLFGAAWRKA